MKIARSPALPFLTVKINPGPGYAQKKHYHPELSINLILNGETRVMIEGRAYEFRRNDLVVIPPLHHHLCIPYDDRLFSFLNLYLDAVWVEDVFEIEVVDIQPQVIHISDNQRRTLVKIQEIAASNRDVFETESEVFRCIEECFTWFDLSTNSETDRKEPRSVAEVKEFITKHFREKVSLDDIAAVTGKNKYSLLRQFSRYAATTPHQYLTNKRINAAQKLLQSPRSVAEIAAECGFADEAHLIRTFKDFTGITPGEYRGRN